MTKLKILHTIQDTMWRSLHLQRRIIPYREINASMKMINQTIIREFGARSFVKVLKCWLPGKRGTLSAMVNNMLEGCFI